jgi:hypothetical protein
MSDNFYNKTQWRIFLFEVSLIVKIFKNYLYFVEIHCPPIATWDDIVPDTNQTLIGTTVNMTCAQQLQFSDVKSSSGNGESIASRYRVSVCGNNGEWIPSIPACTSEL